MQRIKVNTIDIDVSFKDIKNVHLSVHPPDGRVTLSAPRHYELDILQTYAAAKLSWIRKEQSKLRGQERQTDKDYVSRESHYFLGKRYLLEITNAKRAKVILHHSKIELRVPEEYDTKQREALLYHFYRKELRILLHQLVSASAKQMEILVPEFGIKRMKTKWGSCAIERRFLWFNLELAKKPADCIEYVIVHEMAHLLERHHNTNFIQILDHYLPSWRMQKSRLNELPLYTVTV